MRQASTHLACACCLLAAAAAAAAISAAAAVAAAIAESAEVRALMYWRRTALRNRHSLGHWLAGVVSKGTKKGCWRR